jgi:hypothetical protein
MDLKPLRPRPNWPYDGSRPFTVEHKKKTVEVAMAPICQGLKPCRLLFPCPGINHGQLFIVAVFDMRQLTVFDAESA